MVYLSVIPEKNYYLESNTYIKYDYDKLIGQVKNGLSNMTYIDITDNAIVRDAESKLNTVYETSSLGTMDSYDVYLSGATGLVQMVKPLATTDKELVIFGDSFGSSIAPLFLKGYSKVTLVDLRYTTSSIVEEIQNLSNADVLILYSTLVINNSSIIKG